MAVSHDVSSESHTGTSGSSGEGSFQWNHGAASANVKGVLIWVWNNANQNNVTAVTYGGVTVPVVSGAEASDTAGEAGRSTAYFLGSGIPQGTQQVIVTRTNNATVMYAAAVTMLANQDTRVIPGSIVLTTGDGTVAEVAVTDAVGAMTGLDSLRYAAGHFGHQTPPTAGANSTLLQSIDVGATCYLVARETTAGSGSRSVGFSSGTSDDRAIVSLAVTETYSPTPAPLTLTGQVLSLALTLGLSVGSLGLTGLAPTVVEASSGIDIPAGAIAYAGAVPSHSFLGPTVGVLALTGQAPTIVTGGTPLPPAGAVVFQGLTPTLDVSQVATTIAVPAGAQNYTGYVQNPRTGDQILSLQAGQIVFKGPQRPEERPNLGVGAFAWTGRVLSMAVDAPGSNTTIAAGILAFTGQAPLRLIDVTRAIPVGSLSLSGQYVSVAFKQPDAGSLVFQGLAPTLVPGSRTIVFPAGQLVLGGTTLVPTLNTAFVLPIPAGALTWTGRDANIGIAPSGDLSIIVQVGAVTLAGQAPTIDWTTALPVGALTFTGQVLSVQFTTSEPTLGVGRVVWQGYPIELIHSNGTVFDSDVTITRTVASDVTVKRTVSSEVVR